MSSVGEVLFQISLLNMKGTLVSSRCICGSLLSIKMIEADLGVQSSQCQGPSFFSQYIRNLVEFNSKLECFFVPLMIKPLVISNSCSASAYRT